MLKAIQNFGSSSGFVPHRWIKPHSSSGLTLISISTKPPSSAARRSTASPKLSPVDAIRHFRASHVSATRSESQDAAFSSNYPTSTASSPSPAAQPAGYVHKIRFCQWCGGPTKHEIPDGEEKMRAICTHCGKIAYQNPKMVVGCLIVHDDKVLLCKRSIEPSYGLWTLPAGYLEMGESAAEGALRETWEEARAEVEVLSPFCQLDIPRIGQTYIIFLATLKKPRFSPGPESLDCQLFTLDEIPFDSLAFSSIHVTLSLYKDDIKSGRPKFHYGTINKRPGTGPSDIHAYTLDYHLRS